jgi:hypothetical protein
MHQNQLIDTYISCFINQRSIWFKQYITKGGKCGYACQRPDTNQQFGRYEPVTPVVITRHLKGEITASWCAVDENFRSRWLCFDDDGDGGQLDKLQSFLQLNDWHVIREARRPGRGGHAWLLFDQPVEAQLLIWLGDAMMKLSGVKGLERFPKYPAGLSQVRGPLGTHRKPGANGAIGWFEGVEQNLSSQLKWLAEQPLNSAACAVKQAQLNRPVIIPKRESRNFSSDRRRSASIVSFECAVARTHAKPGSNGWWHGHCPLVSNHSNGDRCASLGIIRREDGSAAVRCHAGCEKHAILMALKA